MLLGTAVACAEGGAQDGAAGGIGGEAGRLAGKCVNKGRWPAFERQGGPAGPEPDLSFCTAYSDRTCCSRAQTDAVRISAVQLLEGMSDECRQLWLRLECAPCDPRLGTAKEMLVCTPFCERVHAACRSDWFTVDARTQELRPCHEADTVCSRLEDMSEGAADTCALAGFAAHDGSLLECFNGKEPAPKASKSTRSSKRSKSKGRGDKGGSRGVLGTGLFSGVLGAPDAWKECFVLSCGIVAVVLLVAQMPAFWDALSDMGLGRWGRGGRGVRAANRRKVHAAALARARAQQAAAYDDAFTN